MNALPPTAPGDIINAPLSLNGPAASRPFRSPVGADGQAGAQRSAVGIAVLGLHALAAAGLVWLGVSQVLPGDAPILNVRWLSAEQAPQAEAPPVPKRAEKPQPEQQVKPQPPRVETPPVLQAVAEAPAATTAPKVEEVIPATPAAAPSTAPAAAPIAVAAVRPAVPSEPQTLNPSADCAVRPTPTYPPTSIKLGEEGRVLLRAQLDEKGFPVQVEVLVSSGYSRLDRAARDTVKQHWQCQVRNSAGNWFRIPVPFQLD